MNKRKAFFFSTDALLALVIILITILIVHPFDKPFSKDSYVSSDLIKILSSQKVGEIDNLYVKQLISQGNITDLNNSLLEQAGELYVINEMAAREFLENVLLDFETSENIGIWYGDDAIFTKSSKPYNSSDNIEVESQIISGIKKGESVEGYSARAFMQKSYPSKYFYLGGYVGDGNISAILNYTGTIKEIFMEITINKDFDVYINSNFSGHYEKSASELAPARYDLSAYMPDFHEGSNLIEIKGNNLYIAGGYIKMIYENSGYYGENKKYSFPGISGIINLYDGFYVPGNLTSLSASLHMKSDKEVFFTIGNKTVFNGSTSGEQIFVLNNSQLSSLLDYSTLSKKTTPIRLALKELQQGFGGNADVVLITDLSDSMNFRLDADINGIERNCTDPALYAQNTKKISLAKCIDQMFMDIVLNNSGNRIALSAFYGDESAPYKGRVYEEGLSNNSAYLTSKINLYTPQGGTCICCSINDAYKILNEQSNSSRNRFVVVMSDGIPTHTCQAASGCAGTRTGLPSNEGLWLGYGAGCYGGLDDCEVNDCSCASQNANWSSCRVKQELGATVYSIGFGKVFSCSIANKTLRDIANCGGGEYYPSDNATILQQFYKNIAEEIVRISYTEQVSVIGGNVNSILYPDSYIAFDYLEELLPYGMLLTFEKKFDNEYESTFSVPYDSHIIEARTISYSGKKWTSKIQINNNSFYRLDDYGNDYKFLGDPYSIAIPNNLVLGENLVRLQTGSGPSNLSAGSENNKIIYTITKNMSSYSEILPKAEGCIWNIEFEDNSNLSIAIPVNYTGSELCYFMEDRQEYDNNDALQSAVYGLLESLDLDNNYKADIKINMNDLKISESRITGLPYAWSTEVQIRRWY